MGDPLLTSVAVVVGVVVVVFLALFVLWRMMWRVAEPNEGLVISGLHQGAPNGVGETLGFKIVTGKGTLVLPGVQMVRRLSLDLRETDLQVDCVSQQGIPLKIRAVVIYKVGDDYASIANAARRFLDQQNQMDQRVHNLFAGHLRAIVGNMTVEEMIRDREKLTSLAREHAGTEMEKLGLIVDSMQIQEIIDPTGYIENLARPHAVAVLREARIAQAVADQAATEKEQQAEALKALARRDPAVKQAGYQAEIDQAAATKARGEALAEHQEAVIGQQLAEEWPAIVEAAAKPFGSIDQLIVLNGAEGISEALAQAVSQGAAGLQMARKLLARPTADAPAPNANGRARRKAEKPAAQETSSR